VGKRAVIAIRFRQGGFLAAVFFLLTGCSSVTGTMSDFSETVVPTCPAVSILTDATRLTRFREGSKGDLTDVAFESELREVESSCTWKEDAVMVDLELEFVTARGPAYSQDTNQLTYFIGVTDLYQTVLSKEKLTTKPNVPAGTKAVAWKEKVKQRIPLEPGSNGGDYSVFVGLQLSRAELKYNRQWYGR